MNTYIAVNDMLNITNKDDSDVYSFMAGGLFDSFFAGNAGYSQSFMPSPNLEAFFISQSFPTILSMLDLNEDFVEFALLPMQILIYKQYEGDVVEDIEKVVNQAIDEAKKIKDISRGRSGYNAFKDEDENSKISSKKSGDDFLKELLEERKKGVLKSALQGLAFNQYGPAGAIIAGWLYDGKVNGATVVDVVTGTLANKFGKVIADALAKGLKISSTWGNVAIGFAVSSIIQEAFEVATGLDRSFGFGGDLIGVDEEHGAYYEENFGFFEGVKNMFSRPEVVRHVDKAGNVVGFKDKTGTYRYTNYPTVAGIITGQDKFGLLQYEKRMSEKERKAKREKDILGGYYDKSRNMLEGKELPGSRNLNTNMADSYFEGLRKEVEKSLQKNKKGGPNQSIASARNKAKSKPAKDRTPTEHSAAQGGRSHRSRQSMKNKNI